MESLRVVIESYNNKSKISIPLILRLSHSLKRF